MTHLANFLIKSGLVRTSKSLFARVLTEAKFIYGLLVVNSPKGHKYLGFFKLTKSYKRQIRIP